MRIWHFDPATGHLTGEGEADPCPIEPGVWLIPAQATAEAPPAVPAGHVAVWDGAAWSADVLPAPPSPDVAAAARARRDALLAACDWTQLPDVPLDAAARAAWSAYRAALRAVPQQPGFPADITWPAPPA